MILNLNLNPLKTESVIFNELKKGDWRFFCIFIAMKNVNFINMLDQKIILVVAIGTNRIGEFWFVKVGRNNLL